MIPWGEIAKIVGPSVGFLVVIYWRERYINQLTKQVFDAIEILGKHNYVLEIIATRMRNG